MDGDELMKAPNSGGTLRTARHILCSIVDGGTPDIATTSLGPPEGIALLTNYSAVYSNWSELELEIDPYEPELVTKDRDKFFRIF